MQYHYWPAGIASAAWWSGHWPGTPGSRWRRKHRASNRNMFLSQYPSEYPPSEIHIATTSLTQSFVLSSHSHRPGWTQKVEHQWNVELWVALKHSLCYSQQESAVENKNWFRLVGSYDDGSWSLHAVQQDGHQSEDQHQRTVQLTCNLLQRKDKLSGQKPGSWPDVLYFCL